MKKRLLLMLAALSAFSADLLAGKGFTMLEESAKGVAVSASGQYVVGVNSSGSSWNGNIFMTSFVYDVSSGTLRWMTENDSANPEKGGEFAGASDNGVICGTSKDTGNMFEGVPINAAAVWTNDGKRTLLGYGDFDMSKITRSTDGSSANAISADGKTVAGEFSTSNGAYLIPCMWTQKGDGSWQLSWLPMPEGAKGGQTMAVTADGSVIAGYVRLADNSKYPALWKDGRCVLVTDRELGLADGSTSIDFSAMSANGKFVVASPAGGLSYLYNVENGDVSSIPIMDYLYSSLGDMLSGISNFAVDNEGNVVYSIGYAGSYWRPLLYSYAENRTLDLTYYMNIFAYGVEPDISLSVDEQSPAKTFGISADGSMIVGNVDNPFAPQCWILQVEKGTAKIPATPSGLKAVATGLNQVTLTWDKDVTVYDDFKLLSYNVYCNGSKVKEVLASEAQMRAVVDDVPSGKPGFNVEAVYERSDGSIVLSPRSNSVQVTMSADWSLQLFEDFSSGSLDVNSWEIMYDEDRDINFSYTIDDSYGMGWTNGIAMRTVPGSPYSFALTSRPLDASKAETVHMSFYVCHGLINIEGQILDKDTLCVEVSTDGGVTWTEHKSWDVETLSPSGRQWTLIGLDLSEAVAGKTFRVRLHMHGPGQSYYYLKFDNICICEAPAHEAPAGLINEKAADGTSVKIAWQDNSKAYKLNHINEVPLWRFTIGNAGKEVIGANKFDKADLAMFDGKYLTGVSTKINYYNDKSCTKGVRASVVVYEDGKLVREQEAVGFPYNEEFTVVLDQPLTIDADKELMIGVKVFDYDADQIPLCYVQSLDYLPGKSDLYSEDGGQTWQLVSDFYKTQEEPAEGWCCWDITGCITDDPELVLSDDEDPYAYIVYRNGEQCSDLAVSGKSARFTDKSPVDNACYEVVAYYYEGDYSAMSDQMCIGSLTSVHNYVADGVRIEISRATGTLIVNGDYDSASLIGANGVCVAKSAGHSFSANGLSAGIYMLKIEKDGCQSVRKIMIVK